MVVALMAVFLTSCEKGNSLTELETEKLILEKEQKFVESLQSHSKNGLQLIGYQTVHIDEASVEDFNNYYTENKNDIDNTTEYFYDPENAELRIYFPVESALIDVNGQILEATESGSVALDIRGIDLNAVEVIGRKVTEHVTGVSTNIVKDDIIYLDKARKPDHIINDNVLVCNFGPREIGNHEHHSHDHDGPGKKSGKVSCMGNHGGYTTGPPWYSWRWYNCSAKYNIYNGRCNHNSNVCMDYNGYSTDCVNHSGGWKKYRNWVGSDCASAQARGHCWNEVE